MVLYCHSRAQFLTTILKEDMRNLRNIPPGLHVSPFWKVSMAARNKSVKLCLKRECGEEPSIALLSTAATQCFFCFPSCISTLVSEDGAKKVPDRQRSDAACRGMSVCYWLLNSKEEKRSLQWSRKMKGRVRVHWKKRIRENEEKKWKRQHWNKTPATSWNEKYPKKDTCMKNSVCLIKLEMDILLNKFQTGIVFVWIQN